MFRTVPIPSHDVDSSDLLDESSAGGRFIRGALIRLAAFGISVLLSIASAPLVIRHLGTADYGYFATASAIVFIVGGFTEGGLNALGVREYATGRVDRDVLLRNLVGLRISATSFGLVCAAGVAMLVGAPPSITYGILIAGLGLLVTIVGENLGIPLAADLRLTATAVLGLAQQLVLTVGYVVLVLVGVGVLPLLAVTIASGFTLLASTAWLVRDQVSLTPLFDRKQWRFLLSQTLPYAAATAVGIIYFREALVLMSALSSERQVSYYGAAFRIVEVLTVIPYQLVSAGFPILARAAHNSDSDRLAYALQRLLDTGLIAGAWMTISVAFGASFGISVIAGHAFDPSVSVLRIQGIAILASFVVAIYASVLLSMKRFGDLLMANGVAVTMATGLSLMLIPGMGAKGAAIAAVAAEITLAGLYALLLHRGQTQPRVSLRILPRLLVGAAVAAAATEALPLSSAESLVAFTALYFSILAALGAIPFEVTNAIADRLRGPRG
jgi:O-antigen/teichoic acid export membrane protein